MPLLSWSFQSYIINLAFSANGKKGKWQTNWIPRRRRQGRSMGVEKTLSKQIGKAHFGSKRVGEQNKLTLVNRQNWKHTANSLNIISLLFSSIFSIKINKYFAFINNWLSVERDETVNSIQSHAMLQSILFVSLKFKLRWSDDPLRLNKWHKTCLSSSLRYISICWHLNSQTKI